MNYALGFCLLAFKSIRKAGSVFHSNVSPALHFAACSLRSGLDKLGCADIESCRRIETFFKASGKLDLLSALSF
jgi:hypothetical protein